MRKSMADAVTSGRLPDDTNKLLMLLPTKKATAKFPKLN